MNWVFQFIWLDRFLKNNISSVYSIPNLNHIFYSGTICLFWHYEVQFMFSILDQLGFRGLNTPTYTLTFI